MEKRCQKSAFVPFPALAAALVALTTPIVPLAAQSQGKPAIEVGPPPPTQTAPGQEAPPPISLPPVIGGMPIPPGSDLERMLQEYFSDPMPNPTDPRAHGR